MQNEDVYITNQSLKSDFFSTNYLRVIGGEVEFLKIFHLINSRL